MKKVPVVLVTDVLAQAFGLVTVTLLPAPMTAAISARAFEVVDEDGVRWRLEVRPASPAAGQGAPLQATRRGLRWTLVPQASRCEDRVRVVAPGRPTAGAGIAAGVPCVDGRALERVGSWLQQPAGLPRATDILGQCFVTTWLRNRECIARLHARAERLYDGFGGPCGAPGADGAALHAHPDWAEWRHCRRLLQQLVDCQQQVLGPAARDIPTVTRRQALRRLDALLDAGEMIGVRSGTYSRAG